MEGSKIENNVRNWVNTMVIGLNLCPFAKRVMVKDGIRFTVSPADNQQSLLQTLWQEIELMQKHAEIETTLLIHPRTLTDFTDFNQFLGIIDEFLHESGLENDFQVASFHPDYQFAGTEPDDAGNYTNRAPYPVLHILREESLDAVVDTYPDIDQIPSKNIKLMEEMGVEKLQALLKACFE